MSIYIHIAYYDGSLGTAWGPCSGDGEDPCTCKQCQHADKLEREGKDFAEEYEKARLRNFDRLED